MAESADIEDNIRRLFLGLPEHCVFSSNLFIVRQVRDFLSQRAKDIQNKTNHMSADLEMPESLESINDAFLGTQNFSKKYV
jgi:hypothetical protein